MMKVIICDFPKTTPNEIIQFRINEYNKKGKDVKAELRKDKIALYYIDDDKD